MTPKEAKELSYANRERIVRKEFDAMFSLIDKAFKKALEKGKFSFELRYSLDREYFNDIKGLLYSQYKGFNTSCTYENEDNEIRFYMYW